MAEALLKSEMKALMVNLKRTEKVLLDNEWSFQYTEYMGFGNPKPMAALRWTATEEDKITATTVTKQHIDDHKAVFCFDVSRQKKRAGVMSTEVNNGLESWRGLNATCDSNNKGRQRVRMQYLLQPKSAESIKQTTERSKNVNVT